MYLLTSLTNFDIQATYVDPNQSAPLEQSDMGSHCTAEMLNGLECNTADDIWSRIVAEELKLSKTSSTCSRVKTVSLPKSNNKHLCKFDRKKMLK